MIRNGDLPIQLPPLVRAGDEISARLFNQLITAMKRLSDRTPVESNNVKGNKGSSAPFMPILKAEKGESGFTYKIALSKGYVIERRIPDGQALIYHFPTELVDEDDNPIYHDISEGQAIYVQVQVEDNGTIESDPIVMVAEDELEGEHFRPEVFDFGGNAGTHNYKIAKFEMVNEKPRLKLFGAGDNVDHFDERVGMINVKEESGGVTYEIGKTYESGDDKIHFRTLMQMEGDGQPIIKEDEEGAEKPDSIKFKRIIDRGTDAEVEVKDQDGAILVRGNSYDHDIVDAHKVTITVRDGLVQSMTKIETTGWWGTASFINGAGDPVFSLGFEDGILTSVNDYGGVVAGTQASPGSVGAVVNG
jgi:hypothetical protein